MPAEPAMVCPACRTTGPFRILTRRSDVQISADPPTHYQNIAAYVCTGCGHRQDEPLRRISVVAG